MHPFGLFIAGVLTGYTVSASRKTKQLALPAGPSAFVVGVDCSTWEIVDVPRANLLVRKVYVDSRLRGETDPNKIADAAVRLVVPSCRTPQTGVRNIGELNLYTSFFDSIMALLADDGVYTPQQLAEIQASFQAWHDQAVATLTGAV